VNLVADEGVDRPVVERLRHDGHDVVYVAELSPSIADEEVLQQANARSAILVTADKDFGELVFRQGLVHSWRWPVCRYPIWGSGTPKMTTSRTS
jgi:predicted nuclease of predicted toxin-antitoxin system